MNKDLERFHKSIIEEDLLSIDECIQKGLMIDRSYSYNHVYTQFGRDYISTENFTPLICAVENQSVKVVKHLLKIGAMVIIKSHIGETPLSVATKKGNLEIVKILVEKGAKPSMQTAFLVAIGNKNSDIVKYMVENGVFVNWKYRSGYTPLSKAITTECEEIAKFLLDNGANPEEVDLNGYTALALSVQHQMINVLKHLLQKGANINRIDNKGRTALSVAASNKYLPFVIFLIESGADIHLAQTAVDGYAKGDEDFDIYLQLFKIEQLKLKNSDEEEASVTLLEKQSGSGQEEAFPNLPK